MNYKELLIGAVLGAVIGVPAGAFVEKPLERYLEKRAHDHEKSKSDLESAAENRRLMTEIGYQNAEKTYLSILKVEGLERRIKVQAYQGLSRTYSEWAFCRFFRGLSRKHLPRAAEEYASLAEKEMPGQFETALALAYSYASREAGNSQRSVTSQKVKELLVNRPGDLDLNFLAWEAGLKTGQIEFPDTLDPQKIDSLMILLEVTAHYVRNADQFDNSIQRTKNLSRAELFLQRAGQLAPENELVEFRRGYFFQTKDQWPNAKDYYNKALSKEPDFPRARDNLAAILASEHEFEAARGQLLSVLKTEDAPLGSHIAALHNLGEVYVELNDYEKACDVWSQAAKLSRNADVLSKVHMAMCLYLKNDRTAAKIQYSGAKEFGKKRKINLATVDIYRDKWKVGPKELEVAENLIELTK